MIVSMGYDFASWLLLILALYYVSSVSSYKFTLVSAGAEHQIYLDMLENTRSCVECGALCVQRRPDDGVHKMCEAFSYNTLERQCQLYVAGRDGADASGGPVYKYSGSMCRDPHSSQYQTLNPSPSYGTSTNCMRDIQETILKRIASEAIDDDPDDGFEYVTSWGQTYIWYLSIDAMTFEDAREHCKTLGAYLINFDSSEELATLKTFISGKGSVVSAWVGAHDIASEGDWVTDRHSITLDRSVWSFMPGEPNNSEGKEDCCIYWVSLSQLNDAQCTGTNHAVCERTP